MRDNDGTQHVRTTMETIMLECILPAFIFIGAVAND